MKQFNTYTDKNKASCLIVDALSLAFRYKHSGKLDFAEDYLATVKSLARSYQCGKIVIACDKGSSSYRKALHPGYKGARKEKQATQTEAEAQAFEEFITEFNHTMELCKEEFTLFRFSGVEADDIAAYICANRKSFNIDRIWLISSDADWHQLISEHVSQFSTVSRKEFTAENWHEHYDYPREDHISIKCLMGDSGDSVPGVDRVGPKKAAALVQEYGSALDVAAALPIASKYVHIKNLNAFGADAIMLNYKLMDLVTFCEEAIGEENCKVIYETMENL